MPEPRQRGETEHDTSAEMEQILKEYPNLPANANLDVFLWSDPVFNPGGHFVGNGIDDKEFAAMRREAILTALETLYIQLDKLEIWKRNWSEDVAREQWTIKQLLDHVPPEVREKVFIDRKVFMSDPTFSFQEALESDGYIEKRED